MAGAPLLPWMGTIYNNREGFSHLSAWRQVKLEAFDACRSAV